MKDEDRRELEAILLTVERRLGIRKDFCPLGIALELEPKIKRALKLVADTKPLVTTGVSHHGANR